MKVRAVFFYVLLVAVGLGQSYRPKSGYVPDSSTAVKVAEAVLIPVYGEQQIASERPFTATLKDDVWTVGGTSLPRQQGWNRHGVRWWGSGRQNRKG